MVKQNLETKTKQAILKIEKTVTDIANALYDLSMKLCHIIKSRKDYYTLPDRNDYRR